MYVCIEITWSRICYLYKLAGIWTSIPLYCYTSTDMWTHFCFENSEKYRDWEWEMMQIVGDRDVRNCVVHRQLFESGLSSCGREERARRWLCNHSRKSISPRLTITCACAHSPIKYEKVCIKEVILLFFHRSHPDLVFQGILEYLRYMEDAFYSM